MLVFILACWSLAGWLESANTKFGMNESNKKHPSLFITWLSYFVGSFFQQNLRLFKLNILVHVIYRVLLSQYDIAIILPILNSI